MVVVAVDVQETRIALLVVIHVVCAELLNFGGDPFDLLKVIREGVVQRQEHVVVHVMMVMDRGMSSANVMHQIGSRD